MFKFNHSNLNVFDLEKSIKFYQEALNLKVIREHESADKSFKLAFLKDEAGSDFKLELTWLREMDRPYNLGDNEIHLAITTDDYENSYKKHQEMGCICYENLAMGLYFINDPDGYWIEIMPEKR